MHTKGIDMKYFVIAITLVLFSLPAFGQDRQLLPIPEGEQIYIYPKNGQPNEKVQADKFDCYQKSKMETGFDPSTIPEAESDPPELKDLDSAETPRTFDGEYETPDKGYLKEEAGKQWKSEELLQYNEKKQQYYKAFRSCLEKLGYSVN